MIVNLKIYSACGFFFFFFVGFLAFWLCDSLSLSYIIYIVFDYLLSGSWPIIGTSDREKKKG